MLHNPNTGETGIFWADQGDPALDDGSPGSGTASFRYRYSINGGPWTGPAETSAPYVLIAGAATGATVSVDVTAIDAVGNAGTPATATATVIDAQGPAPQEMDTGPDDAEPPAAGARAAAPPEPGDVKCKWNTVTKNDDQPGRYDYVGEPGIEIKGGLLSYCRAAIPGDLEAAAAARSRGFIAFLCVQIEDPLAFGGWRDLKCDPGGPKFNTTPSDPAEFSAAELCQPGRRTYRLHGTITKIGSGPTSGWPIEIAYINDPEHLGGASGTKYPNVVFQTHNCNEAGVWRRIAARDPGTASQNLSVSLKAGSTDPLPPGLGGSGNHGYEAHHIIPAGEGRGTEGSNTDPKTLIQRYGYDCGVAPNGQFNGVWLRGPDLDPDDPAWANLSAAERKRVSHRTKGVGLHSHNSAYYNWLADRLGAQVNDATDVCTGSALSVLSQARDMLRDGRIPGVDP